MEDKPGKFVTGSSKRPHFWVGGLNNYVEGGTSDFIKFGPTFGWIIFVALLGAAFSMAGAYLIFGAPLACVDEPSSLESIFTWAVCSSDNGFQTIASIQNIAKARPPWTFLTALAATPPAILAWFWRASNRDKDLDNKAQELRLAEESQKNKQFLDATKLLAGEKLAERLAGIYALEQVANTSEPHQIVVLETLSAFIRNELTPATLTIESGKLKKLGADIDAAFQVLERRIYQKNRVVDLVGIVASEIDFGVGRRWSNFDLSEADLSGSKLPQAILRGAILRNTDFEGADLGDADFFGNLHLNRTVFNGASIGKANLSKTTISQCSFDRVDLSQACFRESSIDGLDLNKVIIQTIRGSSKGYPVGYLPEDQEPMDVEHRCIDLRGANLHLVKYKESYLCDCKVPHKINDARDWLDQQATTLGKNWSN